jgi:hypothetical protein
MRANVLAEEGLHDEALVGLEAPLGFAPEAVARGVGQGREGGEGEGGRALHVAGQQEPAGRAVGIARVAGGAQMGGVRRRRGP